MGVDGQGDTNGCLFLTGLYWGLPETQQVELIGSKMRAVCLGLPCVVVCLKTVFVVCMCLLVISVIKKKSCCFAGQ